MASTLVRFSTEYGGPREHGDNPALYSWTVSMYRVEIKRFSWRHHTEPGPGAGAETNQEDHAPERTSL